MARKHRKKGIVKQHAPRTLVAEAQTERKILLNPATDQYEPVLVVVKPAIYKQEPAVGPTTKRGLPNTQPTKGGKK